MYFPRQDSVCISYPTLFIFFQSGCTLYTHTAFCVIWFSYPSRFTSCYFGKFFGFAVPRCMAVYELTLRYVLISTSMYQAVASFCCTIILYLGITYRRIFRTHLTISLSNPLCLTYWTAFLNLYLER